MQRHIDYVHGGGVYIDPAGNLPAKPVRGASTCEICIYEKRPDVYKVRLLRIITDCWETIVLYVKPFC